MCLLVHLVCFVCLIYGGLSDKIETKKCCPPGFGLSYNSSDGYWCNQDFNNFIQPLGVKDSVKIGFPENDSKTETCIDKTMDNKLVKLLNSYVKSSESVSLPTIFKCCPENMSYNKSSKSCDYDEFSSGFPVVDSSADLYNWIIGAPECIYNKALVDHLIKDKITIKNGVLMTNGTQFENGTYCIDKSSMTGEFVVQLCQKGVRKICESRTCIPKCCPFGYMYLDSKTVPTCQPVWNTSFAPFNQNISVQIENAAILTQEKCANGRYVSKSHKIFENGTAQFSSTDFYEPYMNKFCIENFNSKYYKGYNVLVCFPLTTVKQVSNFYYLTGLIISIFFLAFTLTVYFFLQELQNLHGRTVMCHTASLLAAYICLTFVKTPVTHYSSTYCFILGYSILFTFLSAFSWLNVMCFDIWWTFGVVKVRGIKKRNEVKKFLLYSLYAYGLPFLITAITLAIELSPGVPKMFKPDIGSGNCWFNLTNPRSLIYTIYFCIPVGLLIICNIILFSLTARHCIKIRADIQRMQNADGFKKKKILADKQTLIMNLKLFIVMGITWIFELLSYYFREPEYLWVCLDMINVFQGLWIFFIFVVKDNVWKALRHKLGYSNVKESSSGTQTTSVKNSTTSTTSLRNSTKPEEADLIQKMIANSGLPKKSDEKVLPNIPAI